MSRKAEPAPSDARLDDLKGRIAHAHAECLRAVRASIGHARDVGGLLLEAKDVLRRAGRPFQRWVQDETGLSLDQAQRYMRIANHWSALREKAVEVEKLTMAEALKLLSSGPGERQGERPGDDRVPAPGADLDALREEAKEVRLADDSPAAKFVERQAAAVARQIVRLARGKHPAGEAGDLPPATLALAVLQALKKALKPALLVRTDADADAAASAPEHAERVTPHNRLPPSRNGSQKPARA